MAPSQNDAPSAIVVDADNTLWDTNSVFGAARQRMVSVLATDQAVSEPGGPKNEYRDVVRQLARRLSLITGQNDLALLARGMALFLSADAPDRDVGRIEWAARRAEAGASPKDGAQEARIEAAAEAFREALRTAPPLLDGAEALLRAIRGWRATRPDHRQSVLFSEGDPDRLQFAFEAYDIGTGRHFDDIVLREKTQNAFAEVRESIERALGTASVSSQVDIAVLGDSLKRDIRPANAMGCTTVYCPGDFKGHETPDAPVEAPDHTVPTLNDALDILGLSTNGVP